MVGRKQKKSLKKIKKTAHQFIFKKFFYFLNKFIQFVQKTLLNKRGRGRPRKPWWYHARQNFVTKYKRKRRDFKNFVDGWQQKTHQALKTVGLRRGRGRPRKKIPISKRLQAFLEEKQQNLAAWWQPYYDWSEPKIDKFLKIIGVRRRRGRPKKKTGWWRQLLEISLTDFKTDFNWRGIFSLLSTVIILLSAWWGYQYVFADLPSVLDLTRTTPSLTTRILDRNGRLLFRIYEDENRTLVPLSQISSHMIQATVAIEDQDFYQHHGYSAEGIFRALAANFKGEEIQQGGSTITQQLVKNRLLTPERTIRRKLRELLLSVVAEGVYTKQEILEMYLNQVAYGGSTYGVEEAAWRYFNKSAKNLNLAEAALLAGLPAAPSVYSPFGSNPELAFARQEEVLRRMHEDGYITRQQWEEARSAEIVFAEDRIDIRAPHFVMYVKRLLAEKYGEDTVQTGGLEVRTTLDLELQQEAEKVLQQELQRLAALRVGNGASLVTNPKTGEILAMVGSKNYFDFSSGGQVNVTLRPRQPGSSIKPLTYALALESGKTPATIIDDSPVTYEVVGSPPYSPKNYDGKFHGRVTLREALASSYNVPAVKTLAEIGVGTMLDRAAEVGITTWQDRSRFGLSLTLGGGEVTMLEMSQLYGAFANNGALVNLNPFLEISNQLGEVLYRNTCATDEESCFEKQVFEPEVAFLITDILSDNQARIPAFGPRSVLNIPGQEVAVKTGTTNSLRDNWTIGYTTDRLVAVWVGNNDNTPMSFVASGITGASPVWNETMRLLLSEEQPHRFSVPNNLVEVTICKTTGTLPCQGCPVVGEEVFVSGAEPQYACDPAYFESQENKVGQPAGSILQGAQISL
jgi:1A family penicillin-binding protein